jgi:ELWxxDGT repeat protein
MRILRFIFAFALINLCIAKGQTLTQVRDTETDGAFPDDLRVADGKLFFVSATKNEGAQLWVTNGAHAVANNGPAAPTELRVFEGLLYCTSSDESIWRSDGTSGGTYKIYQGSEYDYSFVVGKVGNRLLFHANGKLWASDGTLGNAQVIANTPASRTAPAVIGSDGKLYFAGGDTAFAYQLWKSDGTTAGTTNIGVINNDGIYDLARVGPYIFIKGGVNSSAHVYRSNGTLAGTAIFDIAPSANHNVSFVKTPDRLFFMEGNSLCVTDGDSAQVLLTTNPPTTHWGISPPFMDYMDGALYFNIIDNNAAQLWKSDGTIAGTMSLGNPNPELFLPRHPNPSDPSADVVGWNGFLYYFAYASNTGWGFWRFSEADLTTELVRDLPDNLTLAQPRDLVVFNGALYFSAYDGLEGRKLWRSDGTSGGTQVADDTFNGSYTSFAERIILGESGAAYFLTRTQDLASAMLWKTDGTTLGTQPFIVGLVANPNSDSESESTRIFEHEGIVYFTGNDGTHGYELWRTDGTAPGTFLLKDFYYTSNGFYDPSPRGFTTFRRSVYFAANDVDHNWQLWKTDGSIAGTVRVSEVPGAGLGSISSVQVAGDLLFFVASDQTHGSELWKSDGTTAGTALVKDVALGSNSSDPLIVGVVNNKTLFSAWTPGGAGSLWITDGSEAGTHAVKTNFANGPLYVNGGKVYKNRLYFSAKDNPNTNQELWVSDGTDSGTHIFKDLVPGSDSSVPYAFTEMGDALYFFASAGPGVKNLWKTYGTPEGTSVVVSATESSESGTIGTAGGLLYFRGTTADDRDELWRSDGTAAGTFAIPLSPLVGSSPFGFTARGNQMLFFAFDGFTGIELWRATPDATQEPSRFANISTRAHVGNGDNILIGGFIVTGTAPKKVIIRAIGPSLRNYLPGYLSDPSLRVFNSSGVQIGANDNWREQSGSAEVSATGLAPGDDAEAAIVMTLSPGLYSAHVSGVGGGTGIGLVEIYDLNPFQDSRAANVSTRAVVMGGDDILIGGFIVSGNAPRRMIIRGIGPSLNAGGVPLAGRLPDPLLELRDSNGVLLATNDNWRDDQPMEIAATGLSPADDLDAAMVITLPPGLYTAQIQGAHGATGIALVEVYEIN